MQLYRYIYHNVYVLIPKKNNFRILTSSFDRRNFLVPAIEQQRHSPSTMYCTSSAQRGKVIQEKAVSDGQCWAKVLTQQYLHADSCRYSFDPCWARANFF